MAAASGRLRCICRRAGSSTRKNPRRSTRAPRPSSASPACIVGALAQVMPEKVPAASAGELLVLAFGGRGPDGGRYVVGELIAGGSGAGPGADGVDVIETDATNCMNLPAEAMEMEAPIRVHRVALRRDSGGAGRMARRARHGARIRGARRRGVVLASRRAAFQRRPGSGRRRQRRVGALGDPAGRRTRRGDPVQDHDNCSGRATA